MKTSLPRRLLSLSAALLFIATASGCRTASVSATGSSSAIASRSEFDGITSAAESAPIWRYSENVEFADTHDPSVIELRDGRRFTVAYDQITRDEAFAWKPGRRLSMEYQPDAGAFLVDVSSSRRLRLHAWPERGHPLDLRLRQLLAGNENTMGMMMAYDQAGHWWGLEIERAYTSIAAEAETTAEARAALLEAARQWQIFKTAHQNAAGDLYASREGTIWLVSNAEHRYRLQKDHATLVWSMFGF